jgi:polyisoprenoid-binding protein YceI
MDIKMEVRSIKSTEGSMMNNNTYKALKADNDPEISMVLMNQIKSVKLSGPAVSSRINLTIAGVTKAVDMPVTATGQKNGNVVFEGSKSIKMTDYGITPPVALFGTMKTGDEITIHFKTEFTAGN